MPVRLNGEEVRKMNFEEIDNRYFRKVYAFAYSLSQDAHLAEEITQDTFFRALQHPD